MEDVEREICHEIVCFCEIGADYKKYDIIQYSIEWVKFTYFTCIKMPE